MTHAYQQTANCSSVESKKIALNPIMAHETFNVFFAVQTLRIKKLQYNKKVLDGKEMVINRRSLMQPVQLQNDVEGSGKFPGVDEWAAFFTP